MFTVKLFGWVNEIILKKFAFYIFCRYICKRIEDISRQILVL